MDNLEDTSLSPEEVAREFLGTGKCSLLSYFRFITGAITFSEWMIESETFIRENEEKKERELKINQELELARNMSPREFAEKYVRIRTPDGYKPFTKEQLDEMDIFTKLQPGDQLVLVRGRVSLKIAVLSREIKTVENE